MYLCVCASACMHERSELVTKVRFEDTSFSPKKKACIDILVVFWEVTYLIFSSVSDPYPV